MASRAQVQVVSVPRSSVPRSIVLNRGQRIASVVLRLIAAVVLLQTLFFKFTAAPESVYIFTKVHAEPWGRIGSGVIELIASVLLFVPGLTWAGALLAFGSMSGAILSHLTLLGLVVQNDGGLLFALALTTFICSAIILCLYRRTIPVIGSRL
jgi:putative oxidoreductase